MVTSMDLPTLPAIILPRQPLNLSALPPDAPASAFRLRAQGSTDSQIATDLNCPVSIVDRLIRYHVRTSKRLESTAERRAQRAIQLSRLEEAYASLREPALSGNPKAMKSILDVLTAQRSLLGLDAPTEVVQTNVQDGNYEKWVSALKANRMLTDITIRE